MTVGLQLNIPQATLLDAANALEPDDLEPLGAAWFETAELRLPKPKQTITIRLDEEIVSWFMEQGQGY